MRIKLKLIVFMLTFGAFGVSQDAETMVAVSKVGGLGRMFERTQPSDSFRLPTLLGADLGFGGTISRFAAGRESGFEVGSGLVSWPLIQDRSARYAATTPAFSFDPVRNPRTDSFGMTLGSTREASGIQSVCPPVPEPASLGALATGVLVLFRRRAKRR